MKTARSFQRANVGSGQLFCTTGPETAKSGEKLKSKKKTLVFRVCSDNNYTLVAIWDRADRRNMDHEKLEEVTNDDVLSSMRTFA